MNLIMWSRSTRYRESYEYSVKGEKHQKEKSKPDKVCLSYTHDRDFGIFRNYPIGAEEYKSRRKWCPKPHAEYDGFRAEKGQDMKKRRAISEYDEDDFY